MKMAQRIAISAAAVFLVSAVLSSSVEAQENYEIQVYPYKTVERGHTMVELHSNFTFQGSKSTTDGTLPTNHQWHETIEITHGFNDWFERGIEYYGSLGPLSGFDPKREQQHQIFPAIDLNVSPKWEFNFGVGIGLTRSTDHLILKMLIGRRFE